MFEDISLDEARHLLTDFFEIHTNAPEKNARKRAKQILDAIETEDWVSLGTLPTLRVGESVVAFLPDNYDPNHIYLLRKEAEPNGYSKKIRLKK